MVPGRSGARRTGAGNRFPAIVPIKTVGSRQGRQDRNGNCFLSLCALRVLGVRLIAATLQLALIERQRCAAISAAPGKTYLEVVRSFSHWMSLLVVG